MDKGFTVIGVTVGLVILMACGGIGVVIFLFITRFW